MKQRTVILSDLIEAARHLDAMQDALTRAYVALRERPDPASEEALRQVTRARDAVFDEELDNMLETAITLGGRMQ